MSTAIGAARPRARRDDDGDHGIAAAAAGRLRADASERLRRVVDDLASVTGKAQAVMALEEQIWRLRGIGGGWR